MKSRDKIPPISNSVHMVNARKGWFYQALFYRATLKSIKYSRCTNYRPDKDRLAKEKDSLRESLTREKLGLDSRLRRMRISLKTVEFCLDGCCFLSNILF